MEVVTEDVDNQPYTKVTERGLMPESPPDYFCTHCRPEKFDQRTMCGCPCHEENNQVPMFLIGICLLLAIGLFTVYLSDLDWKIGGIIGFSIALYIGITYTLIWEFNSCWAKMRMHIWVPEIPPYVVCRVCGKRNKVKL